MKKLILLALSTLFFARAQAFPMQVGVEHPHFSVFFEKAASFVGENTSECAKFVNRMFLARFGALMFGSAWELQILRENQKFLDLVWRLPESEFQRTGSFPFLRLENPEKRVEHFEKIYNILESEKNPIGVLGFFYRFSFYADEIAQNPNFLPQTHVAFLAGRARFGVENLSENPQSVAQILQAKYGQIHDFEIDFLKTHLPLDLVLGSGETYFYTDFLIQEHFKKAQERSLLEVFLQKHRNNRITPLLRPVSYSRVSGEILAQMQAQQKGLEKFGNLQILPPANLEISDEWKGVLRQEFGIASARKSLLVPIGKE